MGFKANKNVYVIWQQCIQINSFNIAKKILSLFYHYLCVSYKLHFYNSSNYLFSAHNEPHRLSNQKNFVYQAEIGD